MHRPTCTYIGLSQAKCMHLCLYMHTSYNRLLSSSVELNNSANIDPGKVIVHKIKTRRDCIFMFL